MWQIIKFLLFFTLSLITFIFCFIPIIFFFYSNKFRKLARKYQTNYSILFPILLYIWIIVFSFSGLFVFFSLIYPIGLYSLKSSFVTIIGAEIILIITLTFIIVQLHSQKYTFRVNEIIKTYSDFWILIVLQLIFLLLEIGSSNNEFLLLFYGITPIILIFPYVYNLITYVRPENLVTRLMLDIAKGKDNWVIHNNLQSIFDILIGSLRNDDIATTRDVIHKLNGIDPVDGLEHSRAIIRQKYSEERERGSGPIIDTIKDSISMIRKISRTKKIPLYDELNRFSEYMDNDQ